MADDDPMEGAAGRALLAVGGLVRRAEVSPDGRTLHQIGGREADAFYRDRWSYDKVVRSTHGVNCTGSCSWKVYVKDGIITWEQQQTDYPSVGAGPAGVRAARLPARCGVLLVHVLADPGALPVRARRAGRDVPRGQGPARVTRSRPGPTSRPTRERRRRYQQARGKGGLVRVSLGRGAGDRRRRARARDQGVRPGPGRRVLADPGDVDGVARDRRPVPLADRRRRCCRSTTGTPTCRSPRRRCSATRPTCPSPATGGTPRYLMMWGSNVPVTRTPDAHWMAEARYRGQKVVVVSPDYADNVKFADEWLPAQPGTDGALAMAMGHVILKEFFVDRTDAAVRRLRDPLHRPAVPGRPGAGRRRRLPAGQVPHRRRPAARPDARGGVPAGAVGQRHRRAGGAQRLARAPVRRGRRRPVEPRPRRRSCRG